VLTELDWHVARHEAAHAVAGFLQGWEVTMCERRKDGSGNTVCTPRTDPPLEERGAENAVIFLSGIMLEPAGSAEDHEKLSKLLMAGISPANVYDRTKRLIESGRFRHLHGVVADALLKKPKLTASDFRRIFGAAT
jgi:hypothetical protein